MPYQSTMPPQNFTEDTWVWFLNWVFGKDMEPGTLSFVAMSNRHCEENLPYYYLLLTAARCGNFQRPFENQSTYLLNNILAAWRIPTESAAH